MHCLSRSAERMRITTSGEEETSGSELYWGGWLFRALRYSFTGAGMGKTVLTQGIGSSLGHRGIKSPTFILVSEHDGDLPMVHADLYRLDSYVEADALDFENYIDSGYLLVVEWAERWHTPPLKDTLDITITNGEDDENSRTITVRALGERAIEMLGRLSDEVSKNIR